MDSIKISIIGLGLIGGSLARALRDKLGIAGISAVDPNAESIKRAVSDGYISCGYTELNEDIYDSDIIFICTPVKRVAGYISLLAGRVKRDCILTDVGSTKAETVKYVDSMPEPPCFIGGHPMAGTEKNGYSQSMPHLFENAYYVLTPSKGSTDSALSRLEEIVKGMGAIPVILDASEHDRATGAISHVPHVIASALVNLVRLGDSPDKIMQRLAAGGFKDITRIASASPEMWENIILSNKQQIKDILGTYTDIIKEFVQFIENEDSKSIYNFFESSKAYRDSFATGIKGLINPVYEIVVDVIDKPGIIGEIASILGNNGVNIKNINVSNSREFEQGCLRITLSDFESVNLAFTLLQNKGYKVYKSN